MAKIEINPVPSGFYTTVALNNRFQQIEEAFNDKVLWRDNPIGEPNKMSNLLDMADYQIINLPAGVEDHEPVTVGQVSELIETHLPYLYNRTLRTPDLLRPLPASPERINKLAAFDFEGQPIVVDPSADTVPDLALRVTTLEDETVPDLSLRVTTLEEEIDERVQAVETIADLSTIDAVYDNQIFIVLKEQVGGYAGGGRFYWDASSTADADGYSVIARIGQPTGRFIRAEHSASPDNGIWNPGEEPNAGVYIDYATATYTDFIQLWEELRASYPNSITRSQIGTDESGLYPIWAYTFNPAGPVERTVIGLCNTHGGEVLGQLGVYRFFVKMLAGYNSNSAMDYARASVKYIIVPMVNPWGVSQSPRQRYNYNIVDLNRNSEFHWEEWDTSSAPPSYGGKGSGPWSESEASAIKALADANPGVPVLDLHSYLSNDGPLKYLIYLPFWSLQAGRPAWKQLVDTMRMPGDESLITDDSPAPTLANYLADTGHESITPEYNPGSHGGAAFSSADMRACVRWYGNLLLYAATMQTGFQSVSVSPFVRQYRAGNRNLIVGTTMTPFLEEDVFRVDTPGILLVTGHARVTGTLAKSRIYLGPIIGQDAAFPGGYRTSELSYISYAEVDIQASGERATLPINAVIPVRPGYDIRFNMRGASTLNSALIQDLTVNVTFMPTGGVEGSLYVQQPNNVTDAWTEVVPFAQPLDS